MAQRFQVIAGQEAKVLDWVCKVNGGVPLRFEAVFGITEGDEIRGAFMFNNYTVYDIECHYYGPGTLTRYILREIMLRAIYLFKVVRLTVKTRKASMARGCRKLGAVYEGRQLYMYGPTDADEHAAEVFVFYRERMEQLAGLTRYRSELR